MKPFWKRLRPSKAKIGAVAMDMSAGYWGAVMTHMPKAKIVFDHFHVVKLFNDKLSDLRRALHPEATDIMQKDVLKGTRWLLLKNPENLDVEKNEKQRLEEALALNKPLANGLLPEGRPTSVLEPTREDVRDHVPGWLDSPGEHVRDQSAPADGQDAGRAPHGAVGVLRREDLERTDGGDKQQEQDDRVRRGL